MSKVKTITIDLVFLRMALVPRIYLDSACCCYWYFSFSVLYVLLKSCHICFGVYPYSDALKKWGETRNVVECFSLHLRAVAASCVLYNRTERRQGFSICFI